jgi:hypothetical protein
MLLRESNDKYVAIEKCFKCGCYVFGWKFSSLNPNICEFCAAQQSAQRTCEGHVGGSDVKEWVCQTCGLPIL